MAACTMVWAASRTRPILASSTNLTLRPTALLLPTATAATVQAARAVAPVCQCIVLLACLTMAAPD